LYALERLLHYLLITLGIIIGVASIGVDFTNLALIAGALGVGIGFGLQAIVNNFVSGLILLFERSLRVGDFVELDSGVTGEVKEINVRSTLITTTDNVDVLVPNSEFIGGKMINWTLTDAVRRIHVPFGVAYGSDKDLVRKAALEAAAKVPWSLKNPRKDRAAQVWLVSFGDSSLDFELVVWVNPEAVKRPQVVQAAFLWEIESALRDYRIEIPFPQRDLHLRSGFEGLAGSSKQ
jgi:small-conductance mechanosensitive channel